MKTVIRIVVLAMLVSAGLLWVTRKETLESMSAYAESPNVEFYIIMHTCALCLCFGLAAWKRWHLFYLTVIGLGGLLWFNMYDAQWTHNVFTALAFISASWALIKYSSRLQTTLTIPLAALGAIAFLLGFVTNILSVFLGEVIALACLGAGIIYITKD